MKIIPLSAIKAKLSHYARLCRDQPIIVTVNGRPSFQLVPLDEEDDLIACALEHHPRFGNLLERRLDERLSQTHPVVVDSLNPSGGLQVVRMFFRSQSGPSWVNTTRAPFVECQILR